MEALLLTHPAVQDAAVIGLPDEDAGELPLAFIVRKPRQEVSEKELQKFVEGNLNKNVIALRILIDNSFLLLHFFIDNVSSQKRLRGGVIFLDEIPRNPTGKILRRVLKERAKEIKLKSKL